MTEAEQRALIVKIAHTYMGTPYHAEGRIKGVGVDCLTLEACVWEEAGLLLDIEIPHYSMQFMENKAAENEPYLEGLNKYAKEVDTPDPGNIAIWKFGRCFSHAGIIVRWPLIIHAQRGQKVSLEDVSKNHGMRFIGAEPRPLKFFSYWAKER